MKPILYTAEETNFNHRGLGALNEVLEYKVTEVLNGEFEIFLEYPVSGHLYEEIQDNRQIKAKPNRKDDPHVFRIYEHELDIDTQTVLIYARSNIYDLAGNMVTGLTVRDQTPTQAWNQMKSHALEPIDVTFFSDIETASSATWERQNPLSCVVGEQGSMLQIWGGELKYGNKWLWLYRRRGNDNVTTIRYGKNLAGLKATYSTKGLTTAILPYTTIRVEEKEEEEVTIVGDVVESQYVENYPYTYYQAVEYTEDDDVTDLASLNSKASNYFKEHPEKDLPKINMEVQLIDLSHTKEYAKFKDLENVEIGDTITVYAKKYDVNINAKVNKVVYNGLTDENEELEVGATRASTYDNYRELVDERLDHTIKPIKEQLNIVQIAANGKNKIFRGPNEPIEGMIEGDLWYKPIGNGEVELYIYNGWTWGDPVVTTGVNSQVQAELDKAEGKINEVKEDTEQAQSDADAILEGLGVSDLAETHAEIVANIKDNVEERINTANQLIQQIKVDPETGIGGYKEFKETTEGYATTIAEIKQTPESSIVGYNTLKQTATGNITAIANIIQTPASTITGYNDLKQTAAGNEQSINNITRTPESTITGYNDLKQTAEGNKTTIAKLSTSPGEVILNYQNITETSELYERVLGSTETGVEDNVARIVASSEIIQQEVRRTAEEVTSGKIGTNLLVLPNLTIRALNVDYLRSHDLSQNLVEGKKYLLKIEATDDPTGLRTYSMGDDTGEFKRIGTTNEYELVQIYQSTSSPANEARIINRGTTSIAFSLREVYEMDESSPLAQFSETDTIVRTVQTQLANSWSVKNLNSAGDIVGQINLTDGNALIKGRNIILDGNTIVDGTFVVTNEMIATGITANKITTGTLNAANVNIINLNVDRLVGNIAEFVRVNLNGALGGNVTATGDGIVSTAGDGSQSLVQNGVFLSRQPSGSTVGYIGYNSGTDRPFYSITTSLGSNFSIRTSTASGFRSPLEIYPGSGETYLRSDQTRITGALFVEGNSIMRNALDMTGHNVNDVNILDFNSGGTIESQASTSNMILDPSHNLVLRARGSNALLFDGTHGYMSRTLSMEGNPITNQSDERLKTNIQPHKESSLDKISQFVFTDYHRIKENIDDFGVIAQQVHVVAPEIVLTDKDGYLSINNTRLNMMTTHAVNELKREVETLEEKIIELERRINDQTKSA